MIIIIIIIIIFHFYVIFRYRKWDFCCKCLGWILKTLGTSILFWCPFLARTAIELPLDPWLMGQLSPSTPPLPSLPRSACPYMSWSVTDRSIICIERVWCHDLTWRELENRHDHVTPCLFYTWSGILYSFSILYTRQYINNITPYRSAWYAYLQGKYCQLHKYAGI